MPALSSARPTTAAATPAKAKAKPAARKTAAEKPAVAALEAEAAVAQKAAPKRAAAKKPVAEKAAKKAEKPTPEQLAEIIRGVLDDAKAEDIVLLDLMGKTSLADAMLIATGTSDRHVNALAERILGKIRELRFKAPRVEGMPVCDWVLIDTGDIIIHLFRPEVRGFYNLEKLWGLSRPLEGEETVEPKASRASAPRTGEA